MPHHRRLSTRGLPALALALALALPLAPASHAGAAVPAPAAPVAPMALDETAMLRLFDPGVEPGERREAREALRALAAGGDHAARCLLGRIAFRDIAYPARGAEGQAPADDATALLTRCLLGGDVEAMLQLAELELRADRPLEAAVWVQAYFKLTELLGADWQASAGAYKAALMARINRSWGSRRLSNEEVLEYVAGFLVNHGERIVQACVAGGCQPWPALAGERSLAALGSGRRSSSGMSRDVARLEDNATVTYLLEVDEGGWIQRSWLVESYPLGEVPRQMARAVTGTRFEGAPEGTGPRYRWFSMSFDNGMLELRPDAPVNTRSRE